MRVSSETEVRPNPRPPQRSHSWQGWLRHRGGAAFCLCCAQGSRQTTRERHGLGKLVARWRTAEARLMLRHLSSLKEL